MAIWPEKILNLAIMRCGAESTLLEYYTKQEAKESFASPNYFVIEIPILKKCKKKLKKEYLTNIYFL